MKKKNRKWLIVILSTGLICSLAIVGETLWEYWKGNQTYQESRERFVTAVQTPDATMTDEDPTGADTSGSAPETSADSSADQPAEQDQKEKKPAAVPEPSISVDFKGLQAVNSDIFAWIYIPDSVISYPLLLGMDNSKYLSHSYNGNASRLGSIFLDKDSSPDLLGEHSIIYGHNMKNGAMFGYLKKYYGNQQAFEQHRFIYVLMPDGYVKYEVFSAFSTTTTSGVYLRSFASKQEHQDFLTLSLRSSWISSAVKPTLEDRVLTLSTCSGIGDINKRFVVQAIRVEDTRVASSKQ